MEAVTLRKEKFQKWKEMGCEKTKNFKGMTGDEMAIIYKKLREYFDKSPD